MSFVNLLISIVGTIFILLATIGIIYRNLIAGICNCKRRIPGKTVIITGGSAGIGKATAEDLARRGGRIILACRNLEKAQKAADHIIEVTGNPDVLVMKLELSDLRSVEDFVTNFKQREQQLDILINNAGSVSKKRATSSQGHELVYATNHLGHFLLTNLLIDMLMKSERGRIITVSSGLYKYCKMDFNDLQCERKSYNHLSVYAQSKLCNILFTCELARKLKGTGITCNAIHPGTVATEISNRNYTALEIIVSSVIKLAGKTAAQGAATTIHLAVSAEVQNVTGKYFVDCKEETIRKKGDDIEDAARLWKISETQVGYEFMQSAAATT